MSETIETNDIEGQDAAVVADELSALKARADLLGVSYHPSIGVEKLREKVNAAVTKPEPVKEAVQVATPVSEAMRRKQLKQEAAKLVRIHLTCMNPAKKEWPGEVFTVGNALVGTFKKFIPFEAEEGWHVPQIMYQMLKDRQCQIFVNGKSKNGVTIRTGKIIKEFAIEVLDPLTPKELQELAQRQAMAKSVD